VFEKECEDESALRQAQGKSEESCGLFGRVKLEIDTDHSTSIGVAFEKEERNRNNESKNWSKQQLKAVYQRLKTNDGTSLPWEL